MSISILVLINIIDTGAARASEMILKILVVARGQIFA
jgi:hypothetical protein